MSLVVVRSAVVYKLLTKADRIIHVSGQFGGGSAFEPTAAEWMYLKFFGEPTPCTCGCGAFGVKQTVLEDLLCDRESICN